MLIDNLFNMKYQIGFTFVGAYNKICTVHSYTEDNYLKDDIYSVTTSTNDFWTYRESEIEYMVKKNRIKKISNFV